MPHISIYDTRKPDGPTLFTYEGQVPQKDDIVELVFRAPMESEWPPEVYLRLKEVSRTPYRVIKVHYQITRMHPGSDKVIVMVGVCPAHL